MSETFVEQVPDQSKYLSNPGKLCDFCGQVYDRIWVYPVRGFCTVVQPGIPMEFAAQYWGACVFCRPFVDARDVELLRARAVTLAREDIRPWVSVVTPTVWAVLFDCIHGEAVLTGDDT